MQGVFLTRVDSDNPSTSVQSSWLADNLDTPPPPALELTIVANTNAAK